MYITEKTEKQSEESDDELNTDQAAVLCFVRSNFFATV